MKIKQKTHSQYGYGYPIFVSHKIQSKGGRIKITAENSQSGAATISSQLITLVPLLEV